MLWLLAAAVPALMTKNPVYLLILLGVVYWNYRALGRTSHLAQSWGVFLKMGLLLVAFNVVLNLLFVGAGRTVLFTLPSFEWRSPDGNVVLFQVGGRVTLEALVYGLANGLGLMVVIMTFATFNMLVDHYQLMRRIPRFMYQTGVIASIAITFVPQMINTRREIKEAQMLRGHRFRRLVDLPPLFLALLTEGLERSLELAEAMDARGFGGRLSESGQRRELAFKGMIALALFVLLAGVFTHTYFRLNLIGGVTSGAGVLLICLTLWLIGRSVERSRYRRELWRREDTVISVASAATIVVVCGFWLFARRELVFYPYPILKMPSFNLLLGLSLLLTAAPVLVYRLEKRL